MDTGAAVIEALLLRWGESPAGRTVTFLLPDDGTVHPFKGLKTGPSYGQRVALSVALISDDETQTPVPKEEQASRGKPAKDRKRWSDLPLSQQAAIRCNEPGFETYMEQSYPDYGPNTVERVRTRCGVHSRKDILEGSKAGAVWRQLDNEYQSWLRGGA